MMFCIVLLAIAVYLAIPVFTGKGKLLTTENIKKDKIDAYVKYMRLIYLALFIVVLLMAAFNFVEQVAYTTEHHYEFTEDYTGADGNVYPAGEDHTTAQMQQILVPTESSGSMCAPVDPETVPYRYTGTTHTLKEQYSFLSFLPFETVHVLNFITLGLSMLIIVGLFIFIQRFTDKEQKKKAKATRNSPVRPSMPRGAFDFSDYQDEVEVKDDMFEEEQQAKPSKK